MTMLTAEEVCACLRVCVEVAENICACSYMCERDNNIHKEGYVQV